MTFGGAGYYGDTIGVPLDKPIVGGAADPERRLLARGVRRRHLHLRQRAVLGIGRRPAAEQADRRDGGDARRRRVLARGVRRRHLHLRRRAVLRVDRGASTSTSRSSAWRRRPTAPGYWLVASDGGIFTYGDAQFYGLDRGHPPQQADRRAWRRRPTATATGSSRPTAASSPTATRSSGARPAAWPSTSPSSAWRPRPTADGYWLVAQDAGVFTYGDAQFSGSAQSPLHPPLFPAPLSNADPARRDDHERGDRAPGDPRRAACGSRSPATRWRCTRASTSQQTTPPYARRRRRGGRLRVHQRRRRSYEWSNPGPIYLNPGACAYWADQLQWVVSRFHPDVTVIQTGYWETQIRQFNGNWETLANADYSCLHQVQPRGGGPDRPLRRRRRRPLHRSLLRRRDARTTSSTRTTRSSRAWPQEFPYVSIDDLHSVLDPGGTYQAVDRRDRGRGAPTACTSPRRRWTT